MRNYEVQARGLKFPESTDTRIQMMPFLIADEKTWPEEVKRYGDLVYECLEGFKINGELYPDFQDSPCFITIDESDVKASKTHRSPGIHTEGGYDVYDEHIHWGRGGWGTESHSLGGIGQNRATRESVRYGGIFLVSNVDKSTAVWDMKADKPGELGDCSHFDLDMKDAHITESGELIWMHDKTPHASLPVIQDTHRQFMRIVGPHISHWFNGDNTPNPLLDYRDWLEADERVFTEIQDGERLEDYILRQRKEHPNVVTNYGRRTKIIPGTKLGYLESQKERERSHKILVCERDISLQCSWLADQIEIIYNKKRTLFLADELRTFRNDRKKHKKNRDCLKVREIENEMGLFLSERIDDFIKTAQIDNELRELVKERYNAYEKGDFKKGSAILRKIETKEKTDLEEEYIYVIGHLKAIQELLDKKIN